MRIRQVKPAFWVDKTMAAMTPAIRLSFIGLWMLADDEGYIDWDLEQSAAELYPFEAVHRRERALAAHLACLVERGRVVRYPDCTCLYLPHLKEHQRVSGVRSTRNFDAHAKHLPLSHQQDPLSDSPGRVGNGRGRNGTGKAIQQPKDFGPQTAAVEPWGE